MAAQSLSPLAHYGGSNAPQTEPALCMVHYPDINYQDIVYYSAPKQKQLDSLDEVDPEILATYRS